MMRLPPMLASLTRHRLVVVLMIATTAVSCAVVANIAVLLVDRVRLLAAPSGVSEASVVVLDSSRADADGGGAAQPFGAATRYDADLAALRALPGVVAAAAINGTPFGSGSAVDVASQAGEALRGGGLQASVFTGSVGTLQALGLRLVQGRDFEGAEFQPSNDLGNLGAARTAIVSRELARRVFHADSVVGRLMYVGDHPVQVVGVVEHLMGMAPQVGAPDNEYAMLLPLVPNGNAVTFAVHVTPGASGRVLKRAAAVLAGSDPLRIIDNDMRFDQLRANYFQKESSLLSLLLVAGLAMLVVTAGGIVGLTSFWVQMRTRAIGIRRALGAQRRDIFVYFVIENFVIVSGGILLGGVLAHVLSGVFMTYFEVPVLPFAYLIVGAIALWVTGQLAGMGPALRAAAVPPVVATRTVL